MSDTTDKLLQEMSGKMDKMLKLMVIGLLKETENERDKIDLLDSVGFRPIEIANLLGKTSTNVRVQLTAIRKKRCSAEQEPTNNPQETVKAPVNGGSTNESTK